jgi:DNA-binding IclR family transcriptional regulator
MQVLAQLGEPMSVEMIASLANRDETDVRRVLTWADRLTYVRPEAQDRWGIDPFVAKVVLAVQQQ